MRPEDLNPELESARERVESLGSGARTHRTPLPGGGTMLWHEWGRGVPLVLLHGGFGSWRHWARNVVPLSARYRVLAADTPGLGGSDMPTGTVDPERLGECVASGIRDLIGDTPFHTAAFSFGGVVAGATLTRLIPQVRSLTLCGASGMGLPRGPLELIRREPDMSPRERENAHRENLTRLMLHDPTGRDSDALYIHITNDNAARLRSRRMSLGDSLAHALRKLGGAGVQLNGIWGEYDVTARPWTVHRAAMLRSACAGSRFAVVADAGHWVAFEQHELFNAVLTEYLESQRP